jgi:E3 ubiquitin-protein ligase DOA10
MEKSKLEWERVWNFGRHAHIIKDGKTFCGRNVSMYIKEVQQHPPKKCKRCNELIKLIQFREQFLTA